jgi:hypothetical protein
MKIDRHHHIIIRILGMGLWVLASTLTAFGQSVDQPSEGVNSGNYNIRQSAEFGGRIAEFDGNQGTYNSFVNLYSGPRLLDYSLEVRSLNHAGSLFDNLTINTFGYGGDPNALTRIRASKNKWYNFTALFRYDRNSWDYDLLANPLNPTTSNPTALVGLSPHNFQTTRRIGDYDLTLFPQSRVRVRLGFSRTTAQGLSFSSMHEGTEAQLDQNWETTQNTFRMGTDFRMLPHTNISYDQFLTFYKGDTSWGLDGSPLLNTFLSNGAPVNLGVVFNTAANQPCAPPVILGTGFVSPTCNAFLTYNRFAPVRTFIPTEQLGWQGTYWQRLDVQARFSYTNSEVKNTLAPEFFQGLLSNRRRQETFAGLAVSQRIQSAFDFGATLRVTDKLRVNDTFRFYNFRIPGTFNGTDNWLFAVNLLTTPNVFTPATCPPPFTAATCPQHVSGSVADQIVTGSNNMLQQSVRQNTIELEYDFTPRLGATLGYRYEARDLRQTIIGVQISTFFPGPTAALANRGACAPAILHPLNPDGTCTVVTTTADTDSVGLALVQHAALFGIWARPTDNLRMNFDAQFASQSPGGPTRITPRNFQWYKFRTTYTPVHWASLAGTLNIREFRNNVTGINYLGHNRNYSVSASLNPRDSLGFDFSYNYNNTKSDILICFVATPAPPGSLSCGGAFLTGTSFYNSTQNFGTVNVMYKPIKRVTTYVGYTLTSVDGSSLILNPNQPPGSLRFNYHTPSASILVEITKNITWRGAWNYYDYNEKGDFLTDPTGSLRDFHANIGTLALRYTF